MWCGCYVEDILKDKFLYAYACELIILIENLLTYGFRRRLNEKGPKAMNLRTFLAPLDYP